MLTITVAIAWQNNQLIVRHICGAHRGAMHIGQNVCSTLSHRITPSVQDGRAAGQLRAAIFGTTAGAVGTLAPLWEHMPADMLLLVQKELTLAVPHTAGLNPASFRSALLLLQACIHERPLSGL
jgi:hypothetical protein